MLRSFLASAFGPIVVALPLSAQSVYMPTRDTLRFREVTDSDIRVTTPQGAEIPMKGVHVARIAVVGLPGDSVRAWYDSLTLGMSTPMGNQGPATDSALNSPFVLKVDARGRVTLVSAPRFPASFEGVTDLTHQFDDFFPRLPAVPLRVGLAWSDTSVRTDSTSDKSGRWSSIASYRVERDTVVGGVAALVIAMKQQLSSRSEGPVANQPMRAESQLQGTEDGFFVFAPRVGRLLHRRREGKMQGVLTMRGGMADMAFNQAFSYISTLDAVR